MEACKKNSAAIRQKFLKEQAVFFASTSVPKRIYCRAYVVYQGRSGGPGTKKLFFFSCGMKHGELP